MSRVQDQALALAGVAQFALYAHELAAEGNDRRQRLDRSLHAVFCTDPDEVTDVFSGAGGVDDGARLLDGQLRRGGGSPATSQVARYMGQILRLAGRLQRDGHALGALRGAIDRARLADPGEVTAILDQAYRESVSGLRPRIMVQGHPSYLRNEEFTRRIRTHLLAAIRCAILWRQCGGHMWRLVFQRRQLLAALQDLPRDGPDA